MFIILKLDKIMLISIVLIAIFAVGAVSAADENITDTADEILSAEPSDEVLSTEPTDELEVSQPEDFSELVGLIKNTSSGQTLTLEKDYINDGTYTKGILISKKMTIDGQGHTLDANNKSNIFRVSNNQVVLKNINFINSYTKDYSAVYGKCTVINCTFTDCTSEKDGGALYNGTAYDSTFTNCKAYNVTYDENADPYLNLVCKGGAIYNGDAYNCTFINCKAKFEDTCAGSDIYFKGYGGAIYDGNAYDCSFIECSSVEGGALMGNAYNCSFINCSTNYIGGAIYNGTAYNSTFTNCKAYSSEDENQYHDSLNHDSRKGGAIYNGDAYNCTFIKCEARYYYQYWDWDSKGFGGAIYQGNAYGCSFIECSSVGGGAIIGNAYNSYFERCRSFGIWGGGAGGALQGNATNCTFVNCKSEYGGSIYGGNAYDCSFIGSEVIDGAGNSHGGAIYQGNAYNSYFEKCTCYEGAAIYMGNANDCLFVDCYSKGGGGGIINNGNAYDSIFINCTSKKNGLIAYGTYSNCTFISSLALSPSNLTVTYGEGGILPIRALDSDGNNIDGLTVNVKIYKNNNLINSFSTTTGSDLPIDATPGNYIMELSCAGASPLNVSVTVNKGSPKLALANNFAKSGETANVKVTLSKKATGFVKITINGVTYRVQINSGIAYIDVPNLADGAYAVKATYGGNSYHTSETITDTFHVGKFNQGMELACKNINVGETERLTANMAKDATGFVRFLIGDDTYKVAIENGTANVDVNNLKAGSYSVTLKYGGNYKYNAETVSKTFTVVKSSPGITITANSINVGDAATIKVNLAKDAPGNVWITVNGESHKVPISNGVATLTLSGLKAGTYDVSVKYAGNYKYNAETKAASFNVSKSSPGLTVLKTTVDGKTVLTANIAKDATGNVNFLVNGNTYKAKITNGVATLTLPDMAPGTYTLKSTYNGNYKYLAETKTRSITIK